MIEMTSTITTEPSSAFGDFILRRLRHARTRTQIALNEITAVGIALNAGWIDGEDAIAMLGEAGLDFVITVAST